MKLQPIDVDDVMKEKQEEKQGIDVAVQLLFHAHPYVPLYVQLYLKN